ncbi:MAG: single-stranded-DNA-specific exonuclease RecJ [Burkholderiales bacterium]|nr:single-stranded-DNA-specific exonuclease RecJ [Burkholderiales bacterium]
MQRYHELLRNILEKRGIKNIEDAEVFLNPDYERDFHDPFLMRDMDKACVKLFEVIENKEKTVIYADYDCDGIPGAVIFQDLFKKINYSNYEVYIPGRNTEGYGLNEKAIDEFIKNKVKLLITVDLGIAAISEVAKAEVGGIDVIITDHHLPRVDASQGGSASFVLPKAFAILNPKVDDYPEKMLCGAGVVFKFVQGFIKKYGEYFKIKEGWEKWLLDMAGLATLSDLVPLLGENRAMAYFGMKVLQKSPRRGLQKLLSKLNIKQKYLNEDDIGFMITPRLNAASRMDDPFKAYELLATTDEVEAGILADHLTKINDDRKTMVISIMREVNKKLEKRELKEVIVIGNGEWRVGVLGIVASKIVEAYKRPVFVWGKDENDVIKGSCRSDGSVSLVELMSESIDSFLDFGGHEGAGGFSVDGEKIHFLEDALATSFHKVKREMKGEEISYDVRSTLNEVNKKNWSELEKLSPFGLANPKPVFLFESVKIDNIKKFGKNGSGEHLEITFSDKSTEDVKNKIKGVSFFSNQDSFKTKLEEGKKVSLLANFDMSRFKGKEELRLRIIDIL